MSKIPIAPGRVVRSKAGRDQGRHLMVLQVDDTYAYIADGELRKVERPKKKKHRHLQGLLEFYPSIAGILSDGKLPSNAEIRRCLTERPPRED